MAIRGLGATLVAAFLAACAATGEPTRDPTASASRPASTPAASPTGSTSPDAAARLWFAPMPYAPAGRTDAIDGSEDYDALFAGPDRWPVAGAAVGVVKLYSGWVEWHATDEQLRAIVAATRARGQLLALEIGALVGTEACGMDVEGFNATLDPLRRIHAAGGRVAFVAFDEPFAFGHLYRDERACGWSIERVAKATADFVRELRAFEPGVLVGDIEPLWVELSPELGGWIDAYRDAAGSNFDFFHLDVDWSLDDWPDRVATAAKAIRARGIPAGVIYIGGGETTDASWTDAARAHIEGVEQALGGVPDQIVFQSWFHFPRRVLPETDLTTLTGLVRQYVAAKRTTVTLSSAGSGLVAGRVAAVDGTALAGAPVTASVLPLDGGYAELRLAGTVPSDAVTALVGLRVNTEGAGVGATRFSIYRLSYAEAGATANLVPDPAFVRGRAVWSGTGTAALRFTPSDRDPGTMVDVTASGSQSLVMNGAEFGVSPGKRFDLIAQVNAPPVGAAPPLVVLVFLRGGEVSRVSLPIQPARHDLGGLLADASGGFSLALPAATGRLRVSVRYAGDLDHWGDSEELLLTSP